MIGRISLPERGAICVSGVLNRNRGFMAA